MWIKNENESTNELYIEGLMEEPVQFSKNHFAHVTEEVGEVLVSRFSAIHERSDGEEDNG